MLQKVAGSGTPHVWISLPARRGLRFQLVSGSAVFAPQQHYAPAERPSDNHGASWQPIISEAGPVCRRTGKVGEMLAIPLYLYVVLAFSAFSSSSSSSLFAFLPSCFKLDALAMICDLIWVSLPGFSRNFVPTWSWLPNSLIFWTLLAKDSVSFPRPVEGVLEWNIYILYYIWTCYVSQMTATSIVQRIKRVTGYGEVDVDHADCLFMEEAGKLANLPQMNWILRLFSYCHAMHVYSR